MSPDEGGDPACWLHLFEDEPADDARPPPPAVPPIGQAVGVEVVILGSGTPVAGPARAGAATALVAGGAWVLVDCGRAATQRALDLGLDLTGLVAVAITHHHSDHVNDLAALATTRWSAGAGGPLVVVAPEGPSARFARRCLDAYDDQAFHSQARAGAGARPSVEVRAFGATDEPAEVLVAGDGWRLVSVLVDHHPVAPAVAYRVEHGGAGVVVSGDTAVCPGVEALAQDVDVLVHEALLTDRVAPGLLDWNAGARAVGELAARTRPGTLVLTHLIPAPVTGDDHDAYLAEVRDGGFRGPALVAHDGLRIAGRA